MTRMFDKHRYRYGKFANYVLGPQYRIAGKFGGLNEMIRVSWELSRSRYTDVFYVLLNNSALTSTASRQPSLCPCCFAPSAIWGISGQKRGKGRIDGKTFISRRVNVTHVNIPAFTSHAENVHSISRLARTLHSSSIWTNMKLFFHLIPASTKEISFPLEIYVTIYEFCGLQIVVSLPRRVINSLKNVFVYFFLWVVHKSRMNTRME